MTSLTRTAYHEYSWSADSSDDRLDEGESGARTWKASAPDHPAVRLPGLAAALGGYIHAVTVSPPLPSVSVASCGERGRFLTMSPMTNQALIVLLTAASLVYLGYRLGAAGTIRRRDRDLEVMRNQVDAQLRLAEQQLQAQRDVERERYVQERVEGAYEALGRWLHDLDRTIDEVWAGVHATDAAIRTKAELIVRRWPWEALGVPEYASGAQLYWSGEVRALTRKFAGTSARFTNRATNVLAHSDDGEGLQDLHARLWESCNDMHGILGEVRDQARRDLGVQ